MTGKGDRDLYIDMLKNQIRILEECDVDCQKFGSGMTVIATLNSLAWSAIMINAVLMFMGAWMWAIRVISLYCTYFACLFQFIMLIISGTMMFTDYATMCGRSIEKTAAPEDNWMMRDEYNSTVALWATSWVMMLVIVPIGMVSATTKKDLIMPEDERKEKYEIADNTNRYD